MDIRLCQSLDGDLQVSALKLDSQRNMVYDIQNLRNLRVMLAEYALTMVGFL